MKKYKKKLLFVNESLALAGGEKSLIALLSKLDPNKYEIDLQLFKYGKELDAFIPEHVNILPPLPYTQFVTKGWFKNIGTLINLSTIGFFISKLTYSINIRRGAYNHPEKSQIYWKAAANSLTVSNKKYDVAIAYAQGIPTYYVIDKTEAKRKIAWVNTNVDFPPVNKIFQKSYYKKYDVIVPVSEITKEHLNNVFPQLRSKYYTIYDMIDYAYILNMASLKTVNFNKKIFNILTVSRLNQYMKGFDITLQVCKILKERGVIFHWYVLGEGSYREKIQEFVAVNKLESFITLLGTNSNPYPYYKSADLYVQTSRKEGFGISIAEARLLNLPVVTTRFDTVFMQMVHGKNGLVVDINATAVANAIELLMKNKQLYKSIIEYQKQEQKENYESVEKFDRLINKLCVPI
ncbi:MAG: glycosyltransferase involved in cell wall biosynthesis [Flavobacteriaceae bacterium]|jgi:glycosyltransferase involved in cell wall biosynthesis